VPARRPRSSTAATRSRIACPPSASARRSRHPRPLRAFSAPAGDSSNAVPPTLYWIAPIPDLWPRFPPFARSGWPDGLSRISHQLSAADSDAPHPAEFSHLGVLDVLSSTTPRPSGRKHRWARHLAALAMKADEKRGLSLLAPVGETHPEAQTRRDRGISAALRFRGARSCPVAPEVGAAASPPPPLPLRASAAARDTP